MRLRVLASEPPYGNRANQQNRRDDRRHPIAELRKQGGGAAHYRPLDRTGAAHFVALSSTHTRPGQQRSKVQIRKILQSVATRRLHDNRRKTTTQLVSEIVLHRLGTSAVTLGDVAQALGVSPRTLQRQLIEEGTSYRAIVESSRRNIATFLVAPLVPLATVALWYGLAMNERFQTANALVFFAITGFSYYHLTRQAFCSVDDQHVIRLT